MALLLMVVLITYATVKNSSRTNKLMQFFFGDEDEFYDLIDAHKEVDQRIDTYVDSEMDKIDNKMSKLDVLTK